MSVQSDRSELVRLARENARRVAGRLRRQERDLAQKMPGEARGGEALRNAASVAQRLAELLEKSPARTASSPLQP